MTESAVQGVIDGMRMGATEDRSFAETREPPPVPRVNVCNGADGICGDSVGKRGDEYG